MAIQLGSKRIRQAPRAVHMALLALMCLFVVAKDATAKKGASDERLRVLTPASSTAFAIADFDGDQKPDLATVEAYRGLSSRNTQYAIRFQLTSGAAQILGVTAPDGGLQITARDINGDHALDLLVSTAWQHQQVAVFLNDGHGNFTRADTKSFPAATDTDTHWNPESLPPYDTVALLGSAGNGDAEEENSLLKFAPRTLGFVALPASRRLSRSIFFPLAGRAPPSSILSA